MHQERKNLAWKRQGWGESWEQGLALEFIKGSVEAPAVGSGNLQTLVTKA